MGWYETDQLGNSSCDNTRYNYITEEEYGTSLDHFKVWRFELQSWSADSSLHYIFRVTEKVLTK